MDPAPGGWLEELLEKADLEKAYRVLRGHRGYCAEAWRGRIRSFQLRLTEAMEHLHMAWVISEDQEPKDVIDFVLEIRIAAWRFENSLLQSLDGAEEGFSIEFPEGVTRDCRELEEMLETKQYVDGIERLYVGDGYEACVLFGELVQTARDPHMRPMYHLGLACAQHSEGMKAEAEETMTVAGLAVRGTPSPLFQARGAAAILGIHWYLGETKEADEWETFLRSLPCPEATKVAFCKRAQLIERRCSDLGRLIVL